MKCEHAIEGGICRKTGRGCGCASSFLRIADCADFIPSDIDDIPHTAGMTKQAAWKDVRAKAEAIVANGGVEIIEETPSEVRAYVMSGVVEGMFPVTDGGPYEVILSKRSWENRKNVGGWVQAYLCECKWGQYNSGAPGMRYVGRFCSHAMATLLVANTRARRDFMNDRTAARLAGLIDTDSLDMQFPVGEWRNDPLEPSTLICNYGDAVVGMVFESAGAWAWKIWDLEENEYVNRGDCATPEEGMDLCDGFGREFWMAASKRVGYAYGDYGQDTRWRCSEPGFEGEYDLDGMMALYESDVDKSEYPEFSDWEWDVVRSGFMSKTAGDYSSLPDFETAYGTLVSKHEEPRGYWSMRVYVDPDTNRQVLPEPGKSAVLGADEYSCSIDQSSATWSIMKSPAGSINMDYIVKEHISYIAEEYYKIEDYLRNTLGIEPAYRGAARTAASIHDKSSFNPDEWRYIGRTEDNKADVYTDGIYNLYMGDTSWSIMKDGLDTITIYEEAPDYAGAWRNVEEGNVSDSFSVYGGRGAARKTAEEYIERYDDTWFGRFTVLWDGDTNVYYWQLVCGTDEVESGAGWWPEDVHAECRAAYESHVGRGASRKTAGAFFEVNGVQLEVEHDANHDGQWDVYCEGSKGSNGVLWNAVVEALSGAGYDFGDEYGNWSSIKSQVRQIGEEYAAANGEEYQLSGVLAARRTAELVWPNGEPVDIDMAGDQNDLTDAVAYMHGIDESQAWRWINDGTLSEKEIQKCIDYWGLKDFPSDMRTQIWKEQYKWKYGSRKMAAQEGDQYWDPDGNMMHEVVDVEYDQNDEPTYTFVDENGDTWLGTDTDLDAFERQGARKIAYEPGDVVFKGRVDAIEKGIGRRMEDCFLFVDYGMQGGTYNDMFGDGDMFCARITGHTIEGRWKEGYGIATTVETAVAMACGDASLEIVGPLPFLASRKIAQDIEDIAIGDMFNYDLSDDPDKYWEVVDVDYGSGLCLVQSHDGEEEWWEIEELLADLEYENTFRVGGKTAAVKSATRQFTFAEMKELEDEIDGRELHNADRFKDGGAAYYGSL